MCSNLRYLRLLTPRILERRSGSAVPQVSAPHLAAASPPIRLEAVRYSLAMGTGCSYPPMAVHPGSLSMKDFRSARNLLLKPRAPIIIICLPVPWERASGEKFLIHSPLRRLQRLRQVQLFLPRRATPRSHRHQQPTAYSKRTPTPTRDGYANSTPWRRPSISRLVCEFRPGITWASVASSSREPLPNMCSSGPLDLR